jgi:hypothetical protein
MSASPSTYVSDEAALRRKIIRYAFGIVLAAALAFGIAWPASYLTIVLANMFLLGPHMPFKKGLQFLMIVALASVFAIMLSYLFLPYPFIFSLLIGILLLQLFYAPQEVISTVMRVWLLICSLVIPLMSLQTAVIGEILGGALVIGVAMAIAIVWFAFAIFPDKAVASNSHADQPAKKEEPVPAQQRLVVALKRTAVVYPVVLLFFFFEFQQSALILIYVALYSSFPGFSKGFSAGKSLLASCVSGGLVAYLLYEIVVLVPDFSFLLLLFLAFALLAGSQILGGGKYAKQMQAAFSTIVIVFGSAITSDDVDAGGQMLNRVIQVSIVVAYLALSFGFIEKLFPSKSTNEKLETKDNQ